MRVAGFDAKQFHRGGRVADASKGSTSKKYMGFNSQLGIGAVISDGAEFTRAFVEKSAELRNSFNINEDLPFFSSTQLKQILDLNMAIAFADQVITDVQEMIETVHCSYVILPPKRISEVRVGGFKGPATSRPTNKFIDNLGPMFSYLTASSYLHESQNRSTVEGIEFHIDAFRSKRTFAWKNLTEKTSPKVFWKGDECNPFIACADLLAFLTDVKLYSKWLKLEPNDIKRAWKEYSFDVTINFYNEKSLAIYSWYDSREIDITPYIARPTVFLAVDNIEDPEYSEDEEGTDESDKARKFHHVIKQSNVYHSAVRYAFEMHGSLKIFQRHEDMKSVRDGDIFVYVGQNSKNVGEAYRHAYDIKLLSGLELRQKIKGNL